MAAILAAAVLIATAPQTASAAAAYEAVDAPQGSLDGASSGANTGFGAWDVQNNDTNSYVVRGGLYYPYLSTLGNAAYGGGSYLSAGLPFNTGAGGWTPWKNADGTIGADGTELWASFLVNDFVGSGDFKVTLSDSGIDWNPSSSGLTIQNTGGTWQFGQSGSLMSTGVAGEQGQTMLMVLKMDFAPTGGSATLYVNPTVSAAPSAPTIAGTTVALPAGFTLRSLSWYPGQNKLVGALDEVRFGSGYAAVTPYDAAATPQNAPQRMRSYMIGNSLTDNINTDALRQSVLDRGELLPWARDVILGSPLDNIVNDPGGSSAFTTSPYGGWGNALPNYTWDFVSMEPFDRSLTSDTQSIHTFIDTARQNPANAHTQFAIYERWPRTESDGTLDFQARWDGGLNAADHPEETRAYFEALVQQINADYPNLEKPVVLVPVGDVLYELESQIKGGEITQLSDILDVYEDVSGSRIHFNAIGQFIVGMTYYATMYKESPVGLPDTYGVNDPALALEIQQTVWDVVTHNPYSGVSVPEPASLGLLAAGAAALLRRRRS